MAEDPARTARDPLDLLALTAALHAAAREPQRRPAAWAALCDWLACPVGLYGTGAAAAQAAPAVLLRQMARTGGRCPPLCAGTRRGALCPGPAGRSRAGSVVPTAGGPPGPGADGRPVHDGRRRGGGGTVSAANFVQALDALPVPMVWCRADGAVLHVNAAAGPELAQGRWLRVEQGLLRAGASALQRRLTQTMAQLFTAPVSAADAPSATTIAAPGLDIGVRGVGDVDGAPVLLLSLLVHEAERAGRPFEGRDWPPRQRELAGLLLAGRNLAGAAQAMGIARSTAVSHLSALFRATGTRRQQDLIRQLSRDPFG